MLSRIVILIYLVINIAVFDGVANATPITISGYFNDAANTALIGSDLGAPSFIDDYSIANNVALYSFNVPVSGIVSLDSNGFAQGGADPYFTLFAGNSNAATVAGSNYDQAFLSTGGDFHLAYALAAGDYQVAMGVFANMSLAENYGSGTLGDGFIGLGVPDSLHNYYYELNITLSNQPPKPTPEPGTLLLFSSILLCAPWIRKTF